MNTRVLDHACALLLVDTRVKSQSTRMLKHRCIRDAEFFITIIIKINITV